MQSGDCMLAILISRVPADSTWVQILVHLWPASGHPLTCLGSCRLRRQPTAFSFAQQRYRSSLSGYRSYRAFLAQESVPKWQPRECTAAIAISSKLSRKCICCPDEQFHSKEAIYRWSQGKRMISQRSEQHHHSLPLLEQPILLYT